MSPLVLLAPARFVARVVETLLFGCAEAFRDDTGRLTAVRGRLRDPRDLHALFPLLLGGLVVAWTGGR